MAGRQTRPAPRAGAGAALLSCLLASPALAGCLGQVPSDLALTGAPAGFEVFDEAMRRFLDAKGVTAATIALSLDGELLWTHGYGTMKLQGGPPVPADAMLRLGSVTKSFTRAAVLQLEREGRLSTTDAVFCLQLPVLDHVAYLLGQGECHLRLEPPPSKEPDRRLRDVTVQHLLDHEGGWDLEASGDPMFMSRRIAEEMGVPSPPNQTIIARWMMGQPLDFTPGTKSAYSNFGYMLLGLVIEQVTGRDYTEYLKEGIFGPEVRDDIESGRTLPAQRNPREPEYACRGNGESVFPPHEEVCLPDGAWYHEAVEAAGGLIASAEAVAWFLDHYWLGGEPREPVSAKGPSYRVFGGIPGTLTMARQRPDGLNIVALLNDRQDREGKQFSEEEFLRVLDAAADAYMAGRA